MVSPLFPVKYKGPNVYLANVVTRKRQPLSTDVFQPETGKYYVPFCGWQVGANPTTGVEGELWLLSKIVANVAYWVLISGGNVGTVVSVTGDDGVVTNPDVLGNIDLTGNVVGNGTHSKPLFVQTGGANTEQWDIQLATAVPATPLDSNDAGIASFNNAHFTVDPTSGMVSLSDPVDADLHVSRYIVSAGGSADGANYTTIASAYAAAVLAGAPQTVFVQPGTYTENITLTPGINICSFLGESLNPQVTIIGKLSYSSAGSVTISGINLRTNGDYALQVTGTANSIVNLLGCFLDANNFDFFANSSTSGTVNIDRCKGDTGGAGINYFTLTGGNLLAIRFCRLFNTGGSTKANTVTNCDLSVTYSSLHTPITTSGTSTMGLSYSLITSTATSLTIGGSNSHSASFCTIGGPSAVAAITISSTLNVIHCTVSGTTANVITGAGTINRGYILFNLSGSTITTATQNAFVTI
jgi:hypothetical protein